MDGIMNYVRCHEEDFYAILGCSENSQAEQILTEYKVRALNLHPDKHPDDPDAVAKFQRLQEAKNTLSEPEKRKSYDKWRLSGLAMTHQQWESYHNRVHPCMHWANPPPLANMLNPTPEISSESETIASTQASKSGPFKIIWTGSTNNEIVRKFRNYEI